MLIDDIVISGKQSVYLVGIMQIGKKKRVACTPLDRKLFQFLAGPRSQAKNKKRLQSLKSLGS